MSGAGALEVFRHSLKSVVEEMCVTLQRTAYSTNTKIRRDHTCAIFDTGRHLSQHDVAPQHIGTLVSMVPETIKAYEDRLKPGDSVLTNDPDVGDGRCPTRRAALSCRSCRDG
jgi:N-methylhydantoinase B